MLRNKPLGYRRRFRCINQRSAAFIIALGLVFLFLQVAFAQQATPVPLFISDDEVNAVASQLYCPVCENTPLDVCPSQACVEWRQLIREQLSEGWSEQQIKGYFVNRFGDRVLATPPARGFNWLIYVIPPLAFLLGGWFVIRAFKSWKVPDIKETVTGDQKQEPLADDYVNRLEDELRKM